MMRLAALVLLLATPASAQELELPRSRQGYYVALGLGMGQISIKEEGESLGAWPGSELRLRLGEMVTDDFGLGFELSLGGAAKEEENAGLSGISLEGQWNYWANATARGGFGLGILNISDGEEARGTVGAEYFVGLSYDFFPYTFADGSGGLALTPVLQGRLLPKGDWTVVAGFVGVELTLWSGLPKNQLELPDEQAYERD